jgi:type II secretory pathway component PulF
MLSEPPPPMLPEPPAMRQRRLPDGLLADVLGRLSLALAAGIDVRRAVAAEAGRVPARWRGAFEQAAAGVAAGEPLAVALGRAGGAVSPVVLGMVAVGDRTGRDVEMLAAVSASLAEAVAARRALVALLVPAAVRLAAALAVIGVLIVLSGLLRDLEGRPLDILGVGLTGPRGLAIYAGILAAVTVAIAAAMPVVMHSWQTRGTLRRIGERLPLIGPAARAAEAASWCRAATLAAGAGMDVGSLVALVSRAAPGLAQDPDTVTERLRGGRSLEEALAAGGGFPGEVLDAVGIGEQTGTTAESLGRLVPVFEERARRGFAAAAQGLGWAAWGAVAGLVVLLVFRVMGVYVGIIEQAGRPL